MTVGSAKDNWPDEVYHHRKQQATEGNDEYHFGHDIYAFGMCLLEIGMWECLVYPCWLQQPPRGVANAGAEATILPSERLFTTVNTLRLRDLINEALKPPENRPSTRKSMEIILKTFAPTAKPSSADLQALIEHQVCAMLAISTRKDIEMNSSLHRLSDRKLQVAQKE